MKIYDKDYQRNVKMDKKNKDKSNVKVKAIHEAICTEF